MGTTPRCRPHCCNTVHKYKGTGKQVTVGRGWVGAYLCRPPFWVLQGLRSCPGSGCRGRSAAACAPAPAAAAGRPPSAFPAAASAVLKELATTINSPFPPTPPPPIPRQGFYKQYKLQYNSMPSVKVTAQGMFHSLKYTHSLTHSHS